MAWDSFRFPYRVRRFLSNVEINSEKPLLGTRKSAEWGARYGLLPEAASESSVPYPDRWPRRSAPSVVPVVTASKSRSANDAEASHEGPSSQLEASDSRPSSVLESKFNFISSVVPDEDASVVG